MDIRNIKTFLLAAEFKSFTKAAEELSYVQSTVTTQIKQLEEELGFPLFDRIGKKISLTAFGEEFLPAAYEIMKAVEKAESISAAADGARGKLKVGVTESLMLGIIPELLPKFKKKFKNIELSFKSAHTAELLDELRHNTLDMLYVSKNLDSDPDLKCCFKNEEEIVIICAPEHPAARGERITAKELFGYDFLVTEREGFCYGKLKSMAEKCGEVLKTAVEVDSVFVIAELIKKGMGIGFLPEYYVRKDLESGALVKPKTELEPQKYMSQLLVHKNRWISPFMRGFIELLEENSN